MTLLVGAEREAALQALPTWQLVDEERAIHREFRFESFIHAFGFMSQMAIVSEKMNHHPEWSNVYNHLAIRLTTHDVGGISTLDMQWARIANATFLQFETPS
jgi:4a-hydroxytetrahydrobiopterin dehydratase